MSGRHRAPEAVEPEGLDNTRTLACEQEIGHSPTRRWRQGDAQCAVSGGEVDVIGSRQGVEYRESVGEQGAAADPGVSDARSQFLRAVIPRAKVVSTAVRDGGDPTPVQLPIVSVEFHGAGEPGGVANGRDRNPLFSQIQGVLWG